MCVSSLVPQHVYIPTSICFIFQAGLLNVPQVLQVSDRIKELLSQLRTNAVALVDAFDLNDKKLNSVLGRYDGNVYEHMFDWARRSPLNKTEVSQGHKAEILVQWKLLMASVWV